MTHVTTLMINAITVDETLQIREQINADTVDDYAVAIKDGATLPPVLVFQDGPVSRLVDGFHRLAAAKRAGKRKIQVEMREGDRRAAYLHAIGANATHGLRRTNADKRRAVTAMLKDAEWAAWSDREISNHVGVSHTLVAKMRREIFGIEELNEGETKPELASGSIEENQDLSQNTVATVANSAMLSNPENGDDDGADTPNDYPELGPPTVVGEADQKDACAGDGEYVDPVSSPEVETAETQDVEYGPEVPVETGPVIPPQVQQLTREALEEDHVVHTARIAELTEEVGARDRMISELNRHILELSASDSGPVISGLQQRVAAVTYKLNEANAKIRKLQRKLRTAEQQGLDISAV
ncbi:MAG: ParB/RepB/Spo0J family partition protein [Pseudomonadota bacterium]